MRIFTRLENAQGQLQVQVRTNDSRQPLSLPAKPAGFGSAVNGGELLLTALAVCYCNDIYREAAKRGMRVERVEVEVDAEFGAEGEPAQNVVYRVKVAAHAGAGEIQALTAFTDQVAEIHNTLRVPTPVTLAHIEVETL